VISKEVPGTYTCHETAPNYESVRGDESTSPICPATPASHLHLRESRLWAEKQTTSAQTICVMGRADRLDNHNGLSRGATFRVCMALRRHMHEARCAVCTYLMYVYVHSCNRGSSVVPSPQTILQRRAGVFDRAFAAIAWCCACTCAFVHLLPAVKQMS
jgi:hypothetical protein